MSSQITLIVWIIILILIVIGFLTLVYFAHRDYSKRQIACLFLDGKKYKKIVRYYKIGSLIQTKDLFLLANKKFSKYQISQIVSDGEIKGNIGSFIVPNNDVTIYFEPAVTVKKEGFDLPKYEIEVSASIKELESKNVKQVNLIDIEDLKRHITISNSKIDSHPILNSYLVRQINQNETNLVLKAGEVIYGIVFYKDEVLKIYLRLNNFYVKSNLSNLISLTYHFDDIYSFILTNENISIEEFYKIIDVSYSYIIANSYNKTKQDEYILTISNAELDKYNSNLLSIDYRLAKNLDPLFDEAIKSAELYLENERKILDMFDKLDTSSSLNQKEKVIKELENIQDGPLEDKYYFKPYKYTLKSKLASNMQELYEEFDDVNKLEPSLLKLDKLIEFVSSKKDIYMLDIVYSKDKVNPQAIFSYKDYPFLLINYKQDSQIYRLNIKLDYSYVHTNLIKKHTNILKLANKQNDWYCIYLDDSFTSYSEVYQLILDAYNYIKSIYYEEKNG